MAVYKAPLRITISGGGTDIPGYCDRFGSVIFGAAINKYVHAYFNEDLGFGFDHTPPSSSEEVDKDTLQKLHEFLNHYYNRKMFFPSSGLSVHTYSEVPLGSGLGGSSARWVALIRGFIGEIYHIYSVDNYTIADLAWKFEREFLGEPGGFQDQFFSAFSGVGCVIKRAGNSDICFIQASQPSLNRTINSRFGLVYCGPKSDGFIIPNIDLSVDRHRMVHLSAMSDNSTTICGGLSNVFMYREFGNTLLRRFLESARAKHSAFPEAVTPNVQSTIEEIKSICRNVSCKVQGSGGGGYILVGGTETEMADLYVNSKIPFERIGVV